MVSKADKSAFKKFKINEYEFGTTLGTGKLPINKVHLDEWKLQKIN